MNKPTPVPRTYPSRGCQGPWRFCAGSPLAHRRGMAGPSAGPSAGLCPPRRGGLRAAGRARLQPGAPSPVVCTARNCPPARPYREPRALGGWPRVRSHSPLPIQIRLESDGRRCYIGGLPSQFWVRSCCVPAHTHNIISTYVTAITAIQDAPNFLK